MGTVRETGTIFASSPAKKRSSGGAEPAGSGMIPGMEREPTSGIADGRQGQEREPALWALALTGSVVFQPAPRLCGFREKTGRSSVKWKERSFAE